MLSGQATALLVKGGAVFLGLRKEVVLAVRRGGANVPRPGGGASPTARGHYTCGNRGHVKRFCPRIRAGGMRGGIVARCWVCGGVGHRILDCLGRSLPVVGPNGPIPGGVAGGGTKRAGRPLVGAPTGRGGMLMGGARVGLRRGVAWTGGWCPSGCALGCCLRNAILGIQTGVI